MQAVIPPPAAAPTDRAPQLGPGQALERPTAQIPGHPQLAARPGLVAPQQPQLQAAMIERQLAARRQAQLAVQQAAQQAAEQVLLLTLSFFGMPLAQDKGCRILPKPSSPSETCQKFYLSKFCGRASLALEGTCVGLAQKRCFWQAFLPAELTTCLQSSQTVVATHPIGSANTAGNSETCMQANEEGNQAAIQAAERSNQPRRAAARAYQSFKNQDEYFSDSPADSAEEEERQVLLNLIWNLKEGSKFGKF